MVHVYLWKYLYLCFYVNISIYINTYIHTYIHTRKQRGSKCKRLQGQEHMWYSKYLHRYYIQWIPTVMIEWWYPEVLAVRLWPAYFMFFPKRGSNCMSGSVEHCTRAKRHRWWEIRVEHPPGSTTCGDFSTEALSCGLLEFNTVSVCARRPAETQHISTCCLVSFKHSS